MILVGRVTFEGLAQYWPTAREPEAPLKNALPKTVFSSSHTEASWNNSTIVRKNACEAVRAMKQTPGGDLGLFGSSRLAASLAGEGLIDEFQIVVVPVLLGSGAALLPGLAHRLLCIDDP
jgi:dihydrofolate reductase